MTERKLGSHEKEFTTQAQERLRESGFVILQLQGESIISLKQKGIPFWSEWHDDEKEELLKSKRSMVAVRPDNLFIPGSNVRMSERQELVKQYDATIAKIDPTLQGTLGSPYDYLDLAYQYRKETGRDLFRQHGNIQFAATTKTYKKNLLFVGQSFTGAYVMSYRENKASTTDVYVMPLVFPK